MSSSVTVYPVPNSTLGNVLVPSSCNVNVFSVVGSVPNDFVYPKFVLFGFSSGSVSLWMTTVPQFVMLTGTGLMKSFNCEVKESDARLFKNALPNDSHSPSSKTKSRSSWASPNVRALIGLTVAKPSDSPTGIAVELMVPAAWLAAVRSWAAPHADPVHSRTLIVATAPPCSMRYSISRSPIVRTGFTPLAHKLEDLLSSKSIRVVPDGSCTRVQNRFRNPGPPASGST
jgi:hypothetical protein